MAIKFIEKEQIRQDEQTRYWFDVDGAEFCIVEYAEKGCEVSGEMVTAPSDVLDGEGAPLLHGAERDTLLRTLVITDEMRAE